MAVGIRVIGHRIEREAEWLCPAWRCHHKQAIGVGAACKGEGYSWVYHGGGLTVFHGLTIALLALIVKTFNALPSLLRQRSGVSGF